jgi:BirA family biotin operon repressor/biotin-[acetyl-CoA-carboxylase] ligase
MPILSMMVSVSIAIAIENLTGRVVSLKWPNDIYVGGKKLGGVLCEAETHSALGTLFVLAGFGINLRRPEGGFDPEIADLATSLEALAETCPARDTVLSSVLHAMDEMYRRFEEDGGRHVIQEVRRRDMLRGQIVKLRVGAGVVEGMAVGLGEQGGLLLARGTEEPREFTTGVVIEASRAARTSEDGTSRRGSH